MENDYSLQLITMYATNYFQKYERKRKTNTVIFHPEIKVAFLPKGLFIVLMGQLI